MAEEIPRDVQRFIADHVGSAEQLDALVLLCGSPSRSWTAEALSQAIFSVPQSSARTLAELAERGLAAADGADPPAYRYAPASPAFDARVRELALAYRANRAAVIKRVFSARADPVRSLADAFRLRKD